MQKAAWKREQRRLKQEQKALTAVADRAKRLGLTPRAYLAELRRQHLAASVRLGFDQYGRVN